MSMSSFLKFALFYSECFFYSYTLIRNRWKILAYFNVIKTNNQMLFSLKNQATAIKCNYLFCKFLNADFITYLNIFLNYFTIYFTQFPF